MQLSIQLILIGIALVWIGAVVMLTGKRDDVTFAEILRSGRQVFDSPKDLFKKRHVFVSKCLEYSGVTFVLIGIGFMLWEILR